MNIDNYLPYVLVVQNLVIIVLLTAIWHNSKGWR